MSVHECELFKKKASHIGTLIGIPAWNGPYVPERNVIRGDVKWGDMEMKDSSSVMKLSSSGSHESSDIAFSGNYKRK